MSKLVEGVGFENVAPDFDNETTSSCAGVIAGLRLQCSVCVLYAPCVLCVMRAA